MVTCSWEFSISLCFVGRLDTKFSEMKSMLLSSWIIISPCPLAICTRSHRARTGASTEWVSWPPGYLEPHSEWMLYALTWNTNSYVHSRKVYPHTSLPEFWCPECAHSHVQTEPETSGQGWRLTQFIGHPPRIQNKLEKEKDCTQKADTPLSRYYCPFFQIKKLRQKRLNSFPEVTQLNKEAEIQIFHSKACIFL